MLGGEFTLKKDSSSRSCSCSPSFELFVDLLPQVRGADITLSPNYTAAQGLVSAERGLSMRFPRFLKKRDDKVSVRDLLRLVLCSPDLTTFASLSFFFRVLLIPQLPNNWPSSTWIRTALEMLRLERKWLLLKEKEMKMKTKWMKKMKTRSAV